MIQYVKCYIVGDPSSKYRKQWHLTLWYFGGPQYPISRRGIMSGALRCWNFELVYIK
jgi:hypothetical protein